MSEASESPEICQKRLAKERQASLRKRRKIVNDENCPPEMHLRPRQEVKPSGIRQNCLPKENQFWMEEKNRNSSFAYPTFLTCCAHDKKNIRRYNNVLAYTLFGAYINTIPGQGISDFCIHGQVYHRIDSLLLEEGSQLTFA
ncbi:3820_t:CDS:2, partial [Funneliformis mosseae]